MRTVAIFSKSEDAHNLRSFLEGSGIGAFVRDENIASMNGSSLATGGVKVDVADQDFEQARALYSAAGIGGR